MRSNNLISNMKNKYYKESSDFRVQIFNALGLLGIVFSSFFMGSGISSGMHDLNCMISGRYN